MGRIKIRELLKKGRCLSKEWHFAEALDAFETAIVLDPESANAWWEKALLLYDLGRWKDALESFEKTIVLNPNKVTAWIMKGSVLHHLGRHKDALKAFDKAILLDPKDASAWDWKGTVLDNLGRYKDALDAFNKAIVLDPKNVSAWWWKGLVLDRLGRYKDALDALENVIVLEPYNADNWRKKSLILSKLGRHEEELEAYQTADRLSNQSYEAAECRKNLKSRFIIKSRVKFSVSLMAKPVLTVTRSSLRSKKLVYILVCNKKIPRQKGSSKVVYIGKTEKGIARFAKSAAHRADTIFSQPGVTRFEARVVTLKERASEKSRMKLERAFLLAFKGLYGQVPVCNKQGKRYRTTDEFKCFNKRQLQRILKKLGTQ